MSATELDQQPVNGSDLNSATSAGVSDLGGFDVILAIRQQQSQGVSARDAQ